MFPTILLVDCRYTYASTETSADGGSHYLELEQEAELGGAGAEMGPPVGQKP